MDAGTRTSRRFREGWSLAAGTGVRARVSWLAVAVAVALPLIEIRRVTWNADGSVDVRRPFVVVFVAALAAWIAWSVGARTWRRRAGERRMRERGAECWRDRAWSSAGAERGIARGMRGPSVLLASSLAAVLAYCAWMLSFLGGISPVWWNPTRAGVPEEWGWVPAAAGVVIAAWTLPLAWFLIVLVPRLGRGRLVVSWPQFPQLTGGRCAFHVGTSPGGARIDSVRVFLRCVRTSSRPFLPITNWNARLLWVGEAHLPLGAYAGPQRHLVAMFDVPADAPPTDLHAKDAVRWEVLVLGTIGGADYADSVIVPVYAN